jgi:hypothetical protein
LARRRRRHGACRARGEPLGATPLRLSMPLQYVWRARSSSSRVLKISRPYLSISRYLVLLVDQKKKVREGTDDAAWTSLAKPTTLPHNNGGLQPCSPAHTHAATIARPSIRPCARMRQAYEVAARRAFCHAAAASCRLRIGKVGKGVARPQRRCHLLLPLPDTVLTHHPPLCTRCENVFDQDHQIHVITLHKQRPAKERDS